MFDRLVASKRHAAYRPAVPGGTVSVLLHAGVCAAVVVATLRPHRLAGVAGAPILISWPQPSEDGSDGGGPFDPAPGPVPPIEVPPQSQIALPPVDGDAPFDPKVLLRRVRQAGDDHAVDGAPDSPWSPSALDEPPALLAGPPLAYPTCCVVPAPREPSWCSS